MVSISVSLDGDGICTVRHLKNGKWLRTAIPLEYGGSGGAFSSTDLLAAALGTCIATDLEPVAARHGMRPQEIVIEITKILATHPKRVQALHVLIRVPADTDNEMLTRLERAAGSCLVRRSLASDVQVDIELQKATAQDAQHFGTSLPQ